MTSYIRFQTPWPSVGKEKKIFLASFPIFFFSKSFVKSLGTRNPDILFLYVPAKDKDLRPRSQCSQTRSCRSRPVPPPRACACACACRVNAETSSLWKFSFPGSPGVVASPGQFGTKDSRTQGREGGGRCWWHQRAWQAWAWSLGC